MQNQSFKNIIQNCLGVVKVEVNDENGKTFKMRQAPPAAEAVLGGFPLCHSLLTPCRRACSQFPLLSAS